jgi:capsular polysaccharide biosynthesis protein/Mrp family chromosome partitioning ATPase
MPAPEAPARDLSDYLAIFSRRWLLIALIAVLTIGAAAGFTFTQPRVYRSSMKIVVGQGQGIFLTEVGNVAEQFTQTMGDLLQSYVVANQVIRDLSLTIPPARLLKNLHVVTKPNTAVLEVSYDDTSRVRGLRILTDIGQVFTQQVGQRLAAGPGANPNTAVSAKIFEPAHELPEPVQPKPIRNLGVAAVLGLLLGSVAALIREQLDDTIRSLQHAEQAFGQTATATLPPGLVGYQPLAGGRQAGGRSVIADFAFQRLRASILWSPEARQARTLLVTSARPEEGKTTIASNLAVAIAREGHEVILVEGDLRRPSLYRHLDIAPIPRLIALDDVMRGEATVLQGLVDVSLLSGAGLSANGDGAATVDTAPPPRGRVRALLASPGQSRPAEFGFERTVQVLEELNRHAEYVIIDAPPLLVVTDAYPLAAAVDVVIAVVRNRRSTVTATSAMAKTLDRLMVRRQELVVTDVEPKFAGSYYDYRGPEEKARRDKAAASR